MTDDNFDSIVADLGDVANDMAATLYAAHWNGLYDVVAGTVDAATEVLTALTILRRRVGQESPEGVHDAAHAVARTLADLQDALSALPWVHVDGDDNL